MGCVCLLTDGASAVKSSQIDIVSHGDHQQVGLQADACMLFHMWYTLNSQGQVVISRFLVEHSCWLLIQISSIAPMPQGK